MRFERGVRLHLGEVLALYDHVRFGEALLRIAGNFTLRAMDITFLRNVLRSAPAAGASGGVSGSGEDNRSIVRTGIDAIDDKRHRCVLHFHQLRRIICNLLRYCGNTGDRLPGVTDDRIP